MVFVTFLSRFLFNFPHVYMISNLLHGSLPQKPQSFLSHFFSCAQLSSPVILCLTRLVHIMPFLSYTVRLYIISCIGQVKEELKRYSFNASLLYQNTTIFHPLSQAKSREGENIAEVSSDKSDNLLSRIQIFSSLTAPTCRVEYIKRGR